MNDIAVQASIENICNGNGFKSNIRKNVTEVITYTIAGKFLLRQSLLLTMF